MLKGILAVIAAAIGAAVIVGVVPPPERASAAPAASSQSAAIPVIAAIQATEITAPVAAIASGSCAQAWPYYEASCLRDGRRPNGAARAVRVIPADQSIKRPGSRSARS